MKITVLKALALGALLCVFSFKSANASESSVSYSGDGMNVHMDLVDLGCGQEEALSIMIRGEQFFGTINTSSCRSRQRYQEFTVENLRGNSICTGSVEFFKRSRRDISVAIAEMNFYRTRMNRNCPLSGVYERVLYREHDRGQDYYASLQSRPDAQSGTEVFADPYRACDASIKAPYVTVEGGKGYAGTITTTATYCRGEYSSRGYFEDEAEDGSAFGCRGEIRIRRINRSEEKFAIVFYPKAPVKRGYNCKGIGKEFLVHTYLVRD